MGEFGEWSYGSRLYPVAFSVKLIEMLGKIRVLVPVALLFLLAAYLSHTESRVFARGFSTQSPDGYQQTDENLNVEIGLQPEAIAPGEQTNLIIRLSNPGLFASYPEVRIALPETLTVDFNYLISGLTYNVQSANLLWTPVLDADGGVAQIEIPLIALVAETRHPEQLVSVEVDQGNAPSKTYTAPFWLGIPLTASLSFSPPQVSVGQPVKMFGHLDGPGPVTQLWSLGDGRIVEASNPEVVYSSPGIYEVTLQASNPLKPVTTSGLITVVSQAIAKFDVSDPSPEVGVPINFINKSGGQGPVTYQWDFGDGTTSSDFNPSHAYNGPGQYQIHLTAQNEIGSSEAFLSIEVGTPPVADLVFQEQVEAGALFEAQAFFDDSAMSLEWDMGDGHSYDGETIRHVYWSPGDYVVSLRVFNDFGVTTVQRVVNVLPGKIFLYLPVISTDSNSSPENIVSPDGTSTADNSESNEIQIPLESLSLPPDLTAQEMLFAYINEARRLNQLPPLEFSVELSVAAQAHAADMASVGFTSHEGSDGSSPSTRIARAKYRGGYAGEATAWGMQNSIEPVQYWLASPSHRAIILNPIAKEVGMGFAEDYNSPSVWYWTAEFGSPNLPQVQEEFKEIPEDVADPSQSVNPDEIIPLGPPQNSDFALGPESFLIFTWQRLTPLEVGERFGIYLRANGRIIRLGSVATDLGSGQYEFKIATANIPASYGENFWQIRLEKGEASNIIQETPFWIFFLQEATPDLDPESTPIGALPEPTEVPLEATPTP